MSKNKISGYCGVNTDAVIPALDADSIYSVPLSLKKEGLTYVISVILSNKSG